MGYIRHNIAQGHLFFTDAWNLLNDAELDMLFQEIHQHDNEGREDETEPLTRLAIKGRVGERILNRILHYLNTYKPPIVSLEMAGGMAAPFWLLPTFLWILNLQTLELRDPVVCIDEKDWWPQVHAALKTQTKLRTFRIHWTGMDEAFLLGSKTSNQQVPAYDNIVWTLPELTEYTQHGGPRWTRRQIMKILSWHPTLQRMRLACPLAADAWPTVGEEALSDRWKVLHLSLPIMSQGEHDALAKILPVRLLLFD